MYKRQVQELIPQRVGFRRFEMKDHIMMLNGKRVVFKGVNRHEFSSVSGRVVSREELMKEMEAIGAKYFIVTDTSKDGTLAGPNIDLYRNLKKEFPNAVITASGGISGLADIKKLLFCGIREIIVGKALAAGRVTLEELSEVNRHAR